MTGMMTSPSVKAERTSSKEEIKVWVYYKSFCIWGHLTNCRWLKILILNYLTSPGHLKSFFSVSYFSNVKTNLELFFFPQALLSCFLFTCPFICSPSWNLLLHILFSVFFSGMPYLTEPGEESLLSSPKSLSQTAHLLRHWGVLGLLVQTSVMPKIKIISGSQGPSASLCKTAWTSYYFRMETPLEPSGENS